MNTLCTTAAKLAVMSLIPLCLCACGPSKPSESEAKHSVQNVFSQCAPITISNFKKLNGLPQPDGSYVVQVEFSVKHTPLPENVQRYKNYVAMKSMQDEYNRNNNVAVSLNEKIYQANKDDPNLPELHAQLEQQNQKPDGINKKMGTLAAGSDDHSTYVNSWQFFMGHCTVSEHGGEARFARSLFQSMFPYPIEEAKNLGVEFEEQFTASLAMTKSDNGWVSAGF